ncbi:MAG: D-alanyl-D-alanine carboxypeptidase/D-alanyl-D-alanine-endopeptidase [Tannerella sp.]|jgi:D-alanyl-D-alanine carboxypeptidase/D-alanyl-D-alanine-endopeptidase (penicillin-binding protein 4)|nr:D-alanyl-D-alanine carboxypeptidase/D-alanyl-D-alanine-endopeptidase [Tannerella sp.]
MIFTLLAGLLSLFPGKAQTHPAMQRFLDASYMQGASVSIMIKNVGDGSVLYSYDADREVIPASVLKAVTTATALEILGENFRYETAILYDGHIQGRILDGNIYIRGSGDPTLGSSDMGPDRDKIIREWITAIKNTGIKEITGSVIADESIFDTEGISMKWLREDLGSYYGQGCYGLNIYDNRYSLFLHTGEADSRPGIERSDPDMSSVSFHNYLKTKNIAGDSTYIVGFPYANERYLYGVVPANRSGYKLSGDIPDPALFLSGYLTELLEKENIKITRAPSCHRILSQEGKWNRKDRKMIIATYSPPLKELVRITNHVSNNLYADALLKTVGLKYKQDELLSSFDRGVKSVSEHWEGKGLKTSSLCMFDGSGLALTDKITARFLCDLLSYMATQSGVSKTFVESLPRAGMEGTVKNTLGGSSLQGKARLKSGSMSRVRSYAGYVTAENKQYAVAILINNFSCKQSRIKIDIEQLLLSLF